MAKVENIRVLLGMDYKALEALQKQFSGDAESRLMYAEILGNIDHQIFALEACYTDNRPGNRETLCYHAMLTHLDCVEFINDPV